MSDQLVVFAIPAFDHKMVISGIQSLIETDWLLAKHGIARGYQFVGGDPYLAKVRNHMVSKTLRQFPQMTDFFFIDADVTWPAEAVLKALQSPFDVAGGVYPKKNDNLEFPIDLLLNDNGEFIVQDGWYKADKVPTGFLRIKRHVLERMAATAGRYIDGTAHGEESYNIFEMGYCADTEKEKGRGEWWGEDYAWSRRWMIMGGDIWINPDIDFGHSGFKTWHGNLQKEIDRRVSEGRAKMPAMPIEAHAADFGMAAE